MAARGAGEVQTKSGEWLRRLVGGLLGVGLAVAVPSLGEAQNVFSVDNPQEGDVVSGNVAINGFHCEALEGIRAQFDGFPPGPIGLTERADIVLPSGQCDDIGDGFILNFNWGLLAPGAHTLNFFLGDAAEPFATRNVTVVSVDPPSPFLADVNGECVGKLMGPDGFSTNFRAAWFQGLQNVSIVETGVTPCPEEMAQVGPICVDKYEASVFPNADGSGAQLGVSGDDYGCGDDGQDCENIFAVSQAGGPPSAFITWFQAQQACRNVGKRLLANAEWQAAAAGTPDSSDCNILASGVAATGSLASCVSRWGVFGMVGNVSEWVADWVPRSTVPCGSWSGLGSDDSQCLVGAATAGEPGALTRGGSFFSGTLPGVFAVSGLVAPSEVSRAIGFRCAG